ncbi:Fe2+-dependent dioxygenase [Usitatibacter palustris]|uniref:PKHD-type hydroxylase n=1 Tax=Usitatibacter palustris TaxID=2732487 RepID=A0A6M4H8L4_9PROT|nr:Fe2+-dependent dioxygenase [Usitatibacter palustris]QJR15158.1 PKHD-type hydroxylase [Usitatibacter palustris]
MLLEIPGVLTPEQVQRFRARLDAARWIDGNVTSGHQSAKAKYNEQIPEESAEARELGDEIIEALSRSQLFMSAAVPKQVFPPLFNRYKEGMTFGSHVDSAIRSHGPTRVRIRTDISATIFLAAPEEYDGGELLIEDTYGVQKVKLAAGSMVLYPATSLHRVEPITRGTRIASFFWIQSLVREDAQRALLFDLDMAIIRLTKANPGDPALVSLTGVYHNLLRMWTEV